MREKYESLSATVLRDLAKSRGIKSTSTMKKADLVEAMLAEDAKKEKEKAAKAIEYKHMTFYEAADLAKRAEVTEMWLTHYSPSLTRAESYMDEVHKIFPAASLGKDGRSVELEFEEV